MLCWVFLTLILTLKIRGDSPGIPECIGFDGSFPNKSADCEGFSEDHQICTNTNECCKYSPMVASCFNVSVLKAYGLLRPTKPISSQRVAPSCSRNDFLNRQGNNTDKALDSHVINRRKVVSALECSDFCLREPGCYGFNLETLNDKSRICELLSSGGSIVNRPGYSYWIFYRISYEKAHLMPHCSFYKEGG